MKKDIAHSEDVKLLVNTFYDKVKNDNTLAPVFSHVNWNNHLPIMYSFWGSMLLGEGTYRGYPLQRHLHLRIDSQHFVAWLKVWHETIGELFEGMIAEEAKMRGDAIARVFQLKMGITQPSNNATVL